MKRIFHLCPAVRQRVPRASGNAAVYKKDKEVAAAFTSQRVRDMTNHDFTRAVYSEAERAYRRTISGEGESERNSCTPDIRAEANICITVRQIRRGREGGAL